MLGVSPGLLIAREARGKKTKAEASAVGAIWGTLGDGRHLRVAAEKGVLHRPGDGLGKEFELNHSVRKVSAMFFVLTVYSVRITVSLIEGEEAHSWAKSQEVQLIPAFWGK